MIYWLNVIRDWRVYFLFNDSIELNRIKCRHIHIKKQIHLAILNSPLILYNLYKSFIHSYSITNYAKAFIHIVSVWFPALTKEYSLFSLNGLLIIHDKLVRILHPCLREIFYLCFLLKRNQSSNQRLGIWTLTRLIL